MMRQPGSSAMRRQATGKYFVMSRVNDGDNLPCAHNISLLNLCSLFKNVNKTNLGMSSHVCSDCLCSNVKGLKIQVNYT